MDMNSLYMLLRIGSGLLSLAAVLALGALVFLQSMWQTAKGLGQAAGSVAVMVTSGFQKSLRTPLYPTDELDRWATERLGGLRRSTSDAGGAP